MLKQASLGEASTHGCEFVENCRNSTGKKHGFYEHLLEDVHFPWEFMEDVSGRRTHRLGIHGRREEN